MQQVPANLERFGRETFVLPFVDFVANDRVKPTDSVVSSGAPSELSADDLTAAYWGGGSEGAAHAAPDHARERLSVSLRGADVRRLNQRAAAQGRPVEELLGEIVREGL